MTSGTDQLVTLTARIDVPDAARKLRADVRSFVTAEIARGSFEPCCDSWLSGLSAFSPEFSRVLGARGWLGVTWPKRYGGHERTAYERFVILEELLVAGAPVAAHWIADRQMGPTLLRNGTEAQRQRFLPDMALGKSYWAIGMSEPDSGSDLASVKSRALPVEGGWRLSGRKLWTSHAHRSHYAMVLCRTTPLNEDRHAGLSQLIVDLATPGVEVHPIRMLTGEYHFSEVVFDDVFVPTDMLLGNAGDGWRQVTSELALERSGPERFLSTFPLLNATLARVKSDDASARTIGALGARLWALHRMSLGVAAIVAAGQEPTVGAALVKDAGTRFERDVIDASRGLVNLPPSLESEVAIQRLTAEAILLAPGFSLRGGTNEILRSIIAAGLTS